MKGRTHPPELDTVSDPDFQPMKCGHRALLDRLYQELKAAALHTAQAKITGQPLRGPEVRFAIDLCEPFYGGREFHIHDPNGIDLAFQDAKA